MPPVSDGSVVIGEYVDDWTQIKDGTLAVVITRDEGIVFKKVYNQLQESGQLMMVSTNPIYDPFYVHVRDVLELWKFSGYVSQDFDEQIGMPRDQMSESLKNLQQEVAAIRLEMRKR